MATRSRSRARNKEQANDRRARIIEAAAKAFMDKGYAATSIDDIARVIGCTKGLIYYHFKNKSELFFAIHIQTITSLLAATRPIAASNASAADRLRAMIMSRIDSIIEQLPFQRVSLLGLEMNMMDNTTEDDRAVLTQLIELYDDYEGLFIQVIAEGMSEGVFIRGEARLLSKPLLGAINWMIMWYRPRPNGTQADRERLCNTMADFVIRGVGLQTSGDQ